MFAVYSFVCTYIINVRRKQLSFVPFSPFCKLRSPFSIHITSCNFLSQRDTKGIYRNEWWGVITFFFVSRFRKSIFAEKSLYWKAKGKKGLSIFSVVGSCVQVPSFPSAYFSSSLGGEHYKYFRRRALLGAVTYSDEGPTQHRRAAPKKRLRRRRRLYIPP